MENLDVDGFSGAFISIKNHISLPPYLSENKIFPPPAIWKFLLITQSVILFVILCSLP